ncbi:MAG: 2TM domain-containing protein [Austwickia sp.]|jgi:hypothetical protein|nr:MAG: 2TM domain-containing protein [Austwickia sp.]
MTEPLQPYLPAAAEADLRRRAAKRIKRKRELRQHLTSYAIVIGALWIIWALTSRGYPWPVWPMLGWGIGLAFHIVSLRWDEPPSEAQIAAEAERLRALDQRRGQLPGPQDVVDRDRS